MAGFVRRFRTTPTLEVITQIEGAVIVDQTPDTPLTGAGTGAVLLVGEFEDGAFGVDALDPTNQGIFDVFGTADLEARFGTFGYTRNGVAGSDPCARVHEGELWNGNGWIKLFGNRFSRLMVGRVDTSVGEVSFSPLGCVESSRMLPTSLTVGGTLDITTDIGGPAASDAVTATAAIVPGGTGTFPTLFLGGETITVATNNVTRNVVFSVLDQSAIQVAARIQSVMGSAVVAVENAGEVDITNNERLGSGSIVTLTDVTVGTLATLDLAAGATNGTGNVANLGAVTMAEVAVIVNGSAALGAIDVTASVTPTGALRLCSDTAGVGTIIVSAGTMQAELGLPITVGDAAAHAGGTIPAGTRVSASSISGSSWVTMQTLDIDAGAEGPYVVKVRPALDDGTDVGAALGLVNTVNAADQPTWASLVVNNAAALTAALTEPQLDAAYDAVMVASLSEEYPSAEANYLLSARRSDTVVLSGRANTSDAEAAGLLGRKFSTGSKLGTSPTDAITEVATFRSDRVFYTTLGMQVTIPQIAAVGATGGTGFTDSGTITVRPDGPLTTMDSQLAPEENPGQASDGKLDRFFAVDNFGHVVNIETYKAFKAAGICAPRLDRQSGMIFQSGVTSSITSGLLTQARRKMADFIQDSYAQFLPPFSKRLNTQNRRDGIFGEMQTFLSGLLSEDNPENARIESFSMDDSENAGNTDATRALGVYYIKSKIRTLSSLDDIVAITEIGEGVITTTIED